MTPRGMTPKMVVAGQTPLTTPMRDKLNINQDEDFDAPGNEKYYQVKKHLWIDDNRRSTKNDGESSFLLPD